jgi:hypothetical protein
MNKYHLMTVLILGCIFGMILGIGAGIYIGYDFGLEAVNPNFISQANDAKSFLGLILPGLLSIPVVALCLAAYWPKNTITIHYGDEKVVIKKMNDGEIQTDFPSKPGYERIQKPVDISTMQKLQFLFHGHNDIIYAQKHTLDHQVKCGRG